MSEHRGIRGEILKAIGFIALGFLLGALALPAYTDFMEGFNEGYDAARAEQESDDGAANDPESEKDQDTK